MDREEQENKQFLERQLQWCKKQDRILAEIEMKFREMRRIAQYALAHELTPLEIDQFNGQLKELESEIYLLEKQLHSVVH